MGIGEAKCQSHSSKLLRIDARFGVMRLVVAVVMLSVLVSVIPKLSAELDLLAVFLFVGIFLVLSSVHKRIQAKAAFWQSLGQTYAHDHLRKNRDFAKLPSRLPAWSIENKNKPLPAGHLYAQDS